MEHSAWNGKFFSGLILLSLPILLIACQSASTPARLPGILSTQPATQIPSALFSAPSTHTPTSFFPSPTSVQTSTLNSPASPEIDQLGEPPLPSNPTQLEKGRHLFWLNCMTCHGDQGQGLTDEFRSLYVEEANCWARGCHAGHNGDLGFPIPHVIPAIISSTGDLPPFQTPEQLFEYLRTTHPPQNPGFMPDDDYWALTAYLLTQNNRLAPGIVLP